MSAPLRHHHTALHVADLRRSSAFYVEGLDMTPVDQWRSGEYIGELFARPGVGVTAQLLATQDRAFLLELVQVDAAPPPVEPQPQRRERRTWPSRYPMCRRCLRA